MKPKYKTRNGSSDLFSFKLPKSLSREFASGSIIEGKVRDGRLVIKRAKKAREGWDENFRAMHERGDDAPLDISLHATSSWDKAEWEW